MAHPGKNEIHHAVSTKFLPSETREPQDGVGGGTPAPRKPSVASDRTTSPICNVIITTHASSTFGNRCVAMILTGDAPTARADDEFQVPKTQNLAPHDPRVAGPTQHREGQDDCRHARSETDGKQQGHEDAGKRHAAIREPHEKGISATADVAGRQTDHQADRT
jgi:hypothetical protein